MYTIHITVYNYKLFCATNIYIYTISNYDICYYKELYIPYITVDHSSLHAASVTRKVCSNCADLRPSLVTAVQPSGHRRSFGVPRFSMGSTVKAWPHFITPTALFFLKCGILGLKTGGQVERRGPTK